ncbi:MAG TPA: potassium-transporting ATPase subunit KdpA, partial [Reyranella sp.]|nr:potassium-transporting ATPase subunit KdpA [Reyranella sp.]
MVVGQGLERGEVGLELGLVGQAAIGDEAAASQIAIKQLGTNGGGFFNANSAH